MNNLKNNISFKIAAIFVIVIVLMIPTSLIKSLINEREATKNSAIEEVSSKWSGKQTIIGPFISIPYVKYVKQVGQNDSELPLIPVNDYIHILPTQLTIHGEVQPERRSRGIYEIVVYNSKLTISGSFESSQIAELAIDQKNISFDKAEFVVGINDLRGIEQQVNLEWNKEQFFFSPGVTSPNIVTTGINTNISWNNTENLNYEFKFELDLKGSHVLYFTPVGKVTDINLTSEWVNPSFTGAFLPDSREVTESGFTANWNVLHLNRNFPQIWTGNRYKLDEAAFGIDLLLPVDNYQKSYRTIQYALLFIVFTFLIFFFIEVLNKIFIHPIQYILVGASLIVFYTLLLSISEHFSFNLAFILSALGTLLLIAGYVKAIIKSATLTALLTSILTILYSFIFVIIQLQDFALLIGSIGIFIILGLTMYFSRKLDWYNLNLKEEELG